MSSWQEPSFMDSPNFPGRVTGPGSMRRREDMRARLREEQDTFQTRRRTSREGEGLLFGDAPTTSSLSSLSESLLAKEPLLLTSSSSNPQITISRTYSEGESQSPTGKRKKQSGIPNQNSNSSISSESEDSGSENDVNTASGRNRNKANKVDVSNQSNNNVLNDRLMRDRFRRETLSVSEGPQVVNVQLGMVDYRDVSPMRPARGRRNRMMSQICHQKERIEGQSQSQSITASSNIYGVFLPKDLIREKPRSVSVSGTRLRDQKNTPKASDKFAKELESLRQLVRLSNQKVNQGDKPSEINNENANENINNINSSNNSDKESNDAARNGVYTPKSNSSPNIPAIANAEVGPVERLRKGYSGSSIDLDDNNSGNVGKTKAKKVVKNISYGYEEEDERMRLCKALRIERNLRKDIELSARIRLEKQVEEKSEEIEKLRKQIEEMKVLLEDKDKEIQRLKRDSQKN